MRKLITAMTVAMATQVAADNHTDFHKRFSDLIKIEGNESSEDTLEGYERTGPHSAMVLLRGNIIKETDQGVIVVYKSRIFACSPMYPEITFDCIEHRSVPSQVIKK